MVLGFLCALTPLTIDMYLPAFPEIARDLGISVHQVAWTVSIYFIGFALGQIFYGPLLDRFGRKRPIYFGLSLYLIANIGCLSARSLEALLFFRFLSALGGCSASVGATAMVRDYFEKEAAAKVFSMLMLVLSVSPLLAPTLGGFVVVHESWRTIFAILAGVAVLDLFLIASLPNAYAADKSVLLRPRAVLSKYRQVLGESQFFVYSVAGAFSFSGLFVYVAGSPAIFMEDFHLSAQTYGGVFAFLAVGMVGGGQLNLLLVERFNSRKIFFTLLCAQAVLGGIFLAGTLLGGWGLVPTIALLFAILLCCGITYPNAAALALEPFSKDVGSASALLGFVQLGIGALTSMGVGFLDAKGSLPTAGVIFTSSILGLMVLSLRRTSRA